MRINDQIFQIGDINVRSMSSEQVAAVLRQSSMQGQVVKFIVARPIHNPVGDIELVNSVDKIEFDSNNKPIITNLKSNSQSFVIKTSEVMDKKINLQQRIEAEIELLKSQQQEQEQQQQQQLEPEPEPESLQKMSPKLEEAEVAVKDEPPKINQIVPAEEKKTEEQLVVLKLITSAELKESELLIELKLDATTTTTTTTIDYLNDQFRRFSLRFDKYVDKNTNDTIVYISEKKQSLEGLTVDECEIIKNKLELYDRVIEINNQPVRDDYMVTSELRLKLDNEWQFKLFFLREKWLKFIQKERENNDEYRNAQVDIIVSRIDKSRSKSLGISLEGTVDIDDQGNETYPHHYIRSIMKNGPVENAIDVKFKPGDELLEIDFTRLYAINYIELLDILKALKSKVIYLVCARKSTVETLTPVEPATINGKMSKRAKSEGFLDQTKLLGEANADVAISTETVPAIEPVSSVVNGNNGVNGVTITSKLIPTTKSTPVISENLLKESTNESTIISSSVKKTKRKHQQQQQQQQQFKSNQLCVRSRSLELNGLALWNKKVNYISLVKGEKGLGFSLIDYQQDPFNPLSKTMIVIRALVPNGVAQTDGRLLPGQRLVSVNDVILDEELLFDNTTSTTTDNERNYLSSTSLNQQLKSACSTGSISKLNNAPMPVLDLLKFTVDLLKSIPIGQIVRLGVQKPLPYPDAAEESNENVISSSSSTTTAQRKRPYSQAAPKDRGSSGTGVVKMVKIKPKSKASQSSHNLFNNKSHLLSTSSSTSTPQANKKKSKTKIVKKKVITTSHYDLKQGEEVDDEPPGETSTEAETTPEETKPKPTVPDQLKLQDDLFEHEMHYGIVATSAPAILNQETTVELSSNSTYSFYSSASLIKLNTMNLVNKINESSSKTNSTHELAAGTKHQPPIEPVKSSPSPKPIKSTLSSQPASSTITKSLKFKTSDDLVTTSEHLSGERDKDSSLNLVSSSTPKSQIKSCIKSSTNVINKSASMPMPARDLLIKDDHDDEDDHGDYSDVGRGEMLDLDLTTLDKNELARLNNDALTKRMANSAIYLNYLLSNEHRKQRELDKDKQQLAYETTPYLMDNYNFMMMNLEEDKYKYNNKQLITEEQFNQAFILNVSKIFLKTIV